MRSPPLRNSTTASPSPRQINSDDDVVDEVVVEFVDGKELTEGKKEGDDDEEGTKEDGEGKGNASFHDATFLD